MLKLCSFLSYSGPFNQEFRTMLLGTWLNDLLKRKIPVSMNLNITEQLTDTATVIESDIAFFVTVINKMRMSKKIYVKGFRKLTLCVDNNIHKYNHNHK